VQRKASYTRDILREELLEDDSGKSSLKGQAQESSAEISERNFRGFKFLLFFQVVLSCSSVPAK
jgi:hypothetical protein